MEVLALDHVTASRGDRRVLSAFNLRLNAGAHTAIVGPSGAGKSTLLGLICGIFKPDKGSISFLGQDIAPLPAAARDKLRAKHMGVIFQTLGLASALTVGGNLALAQRMAGQNADKDLAIRLLAQLGLADRLDSKPRHLSRGEAQRAAIARALIIRPALLIADEPTSSLDTAWRDAVIDLLFETSASEDMTLLLSTHDAAIAKQFDHGVTLNSEHHA